MVKSKRFRYPHLLTIDLQDTIEIVFGVMFGLLLFLGASELWNIGSVLNDFLVVGMILTNLVLLYFLTRFIAGRMHKGSLFLESVRHPLERSVIVYIIGFFISLSTVLWLKEVGILTSFVSITTGFFPQYLRIAVLANLFATLVATTIDLSIAD